MEGSCDLKPWDKLRELGCLADTGASSSASCSGRPWEHFCTSNAGPYADHTQTADDNGGDVVEETQENAGHQL